MTGWKAHLRCPKCGGTFDYEYLPGGSFSAVRLGTHRYFRCPLCHRFALFDLRGNPEPTRASAAPAYSDTRHLLRWLLVFLLPAAVAVTALALVLPHPEPAEAVGIGGAAVIAVGCLVILSLSSVPRASSVSKR